MNEKAWREQRNDRTIRYAGRILDPNQPILLRADRDYAATYEGQVAVITAANLLGRMTPSLCVDLPSERLLEPLPWAGSCLRDHVLEVLLVADPYARFECRTERAGDHVVQLGRNGATTIAHGSGWNVYVGPSPSPLVQTDGANFSGAAMAAILAVADLFINQFSPCTHAVIINTLTWENHHIPGGVFCLPHKPDLGNLWMVGAGSVGSSILFFLVLATQQFCPTLIDMDFVKIENLDRSPVLRAKDVGRKKVEATKAFLQNCGVEDVSVEPYALDELAIWQNRKPGVPDLVISAANERNVRDLIENGYPPIQIYATTGRNWQASLIRHIPMIDPCSRCLFAESTYEPTRCATGDLILKNEEEPVDAALPFLSFAAGTMAATEIAKLSMPGYPFSPNRVGLYALANSQLRHEPLPFRRGCICQTRSRDVHAKAIAGSAYAELSSHA